MLLFFSSWRSSRHKTLVHLYLERVPSPPWSRPQCLPTLPLRFLRVPLLSRFRNPLHQPLSPLSLELLFWLLELERSFKWSIARVHVRWRRFWSELVEWWCSKFIWILTFISERELLTFARWLLVLSHVNVAKACQYLVWSDFSITWSFPSGFCWVT